METLKIILILIIGFLVLKPEYLEVIAKKIGFYWKKINIMKQSIQNLDEPTKENKQTTKTLAKEKTAIKSDNTKKSRQKSPTN